MVAARRALAGGAPDRRARDPPLGQGENAHWHPDGTAESFVKVRVHNHGSVEARDVVVRWSLKSPGGAGSDADFVKQDDSEPQDIPPESFRDFKFSWYPTQGVHSCIKVQLLNWDADLGDLDLTNNQTHENIFNFDAAADGGAALTAATPAYEPVVFDFSVATDLPVPADVHLDVSGLVPGVDMELEQDQLHMEPREEVWLKARITVDAALTQADGTFSAVVTDVPDGPATVMVYYWGPLMTSSVLGPVALDIDCGPRPPRPVKPTLTVGKRDEETLHLGYDAATCVSNGHTLVIGELGAFGLATDAVCAIGSSGVADVPMPSGNAWFLIGGTGEGMYSSLGQSSKGERPMSGLEAICTELTGQDPGPTCE